MTSMHLSEGDTSCSEMEFSHGRGGGGVRRMAVIRSFGLPDAEEAKLLAMANDPTVVDLFATVAPDLARGDLNLGFLRIALEACLTQTVLSVEDMAKEHSELTIKAVKKERELWTQGEKERKRLSEQALVDEYEVKLKQSKRTHAKQMTRLRDELKAEGRREMRSVVAQLNGIMHTVHASLDQLERTSNDLLTSTGTTQPLRVSRTAIPQPRGLQEHDEDGSDEDEVELELSREPPDVEGMLEDVARGVEAGFAGVAEAVGGVAEGLREKGDQAAKAAVATVREELASDAEFALRCALAARKETKTVGVVTTMRQSDIEGLLQAAKDKDEAPRSHAAAANTADSAVSEVKRALDRVSKQHEASLQHLSDLQARLAALRKTEQTTEGIRFFLTQFLTSLPADLHAQLPAPSVPDRDLKRMAKALRAPKTTDPPADAPAAGQHTRAPAAAAGSVPPPLVAAGGEEPAGPGGKSGLEASRLDEVDEEPACRGLKVLGLRNPGGGSQVATSCRVENAASVVYDDAAEGGGYNAAPAGRYLGSVCTARVLSADRALRIRHLAPKLHAALRSGRADPSAFHLRHPLRDRAPSAIPRLRGQQLLAA
ncbi:hypothetical protein DIPPA_23131 [Diplonema papillatum]|nr:hypothetical protein DIPPA_23131 [Diplonema papillatum]